MLFIDFYSGMLRKTKILICSLSFLLLCIGLQIDMHFSGTELFSISLFGDARSCCDGPCDCCHNEGVYVVLKADYLLSEQLILASSLPIVDVFWVTSHEGSENYHPDLIKSKFLFPDSPPLICWQPDHVFLQQFRC